MGLTFLSLRSHSAPCLALRRQLVPLLLFCAFTAALIAAAGEGCSAAVADKGSALTNSDPCRCRRHCPASSETSSDNHHRAEPCRDIKPTFDNKSARCFAVGYRLHQDLQWQIRGRYVHRVHIYRLGQVSRQICKAILITAL